MTIERTSGDMFTEMKRQLAVEIVSHRTQEEIEKTKAQFGDACTVTQKKLKQHFGQQFEPYYLKDKIVYLWADQESESENLQVFQLAKSKDRLVLMAGVHAMSGAPWDIVTKTNNVENWVHDTLNQAQIAKTTIERNTHELTLPIVD